jgi:hypothetical protein
VYGNLRIDEPAGVIYRKRVSTETYWGSPDSEPALRAISFLSTTESRWITWSPGPNGWLGPTLRSAVTGGEAGFQVCLDYLRSFTFTIFRRIPYGIYLRNPDVVFRGAQSMFFLLD